MLEIVNILVIIHQSDNFKCLFYLSDQEKPEDLHLNYTYDLKKLQICTF